MKLFEPRFIPEFLPKLLTALPLTLAIVGIATVAGILLGLLMAVARLERTPVLAQISAVLVSFLRGTPILVQLFLVYYGLPLLLLLVGIDVMRAEKILFVYVTYSLNSSAFFSESIRSA
ncbi:MAG: ABC transporter permease subunit, partial [Oscillospiraceae bacterium]|nr:ABC transporter permease subunit [Oscillospiraceae bacterium]